MGPNDVRAISALLVDASGSSIVAPAPSLVALTFAAGAALSSAVSFVNVCPARIIMPATWTAAVLTVQTSDDAGVTFQDLYDASGNVYTIQAAASRAINLSVTDLLLVRCLRFRSGTPTTPVNQVAAATLNLVVG